MGLALLSEERFSQLRNIFSEEVFALARSANEYSDVCRKILYRVYKKVKYNKEEEEEKVGKENIVDPVNDYILRKRYTQKIKLSKLERMKILAQHRKNHERADNIVKQKEKEKLLKMTSDSKEKPIVEKINLDDDEDDSEEDEKEVQVITNGKNKTNGHKNNNKNKYEENSEDDDLEEDADGEMDDNEDNEDNEDNQDNEDNEDDEDSQDAENNEDFEDDEGAEGEGLEDYLDMEEYEEDEFIGDEFDDDDDFDFENSFLPPNGFTYVTGGTSAKENDLVARNTFLNRKRMANDELPEPHKRRSSISSNSNGTSNKKNKKKVCFKLYNNNVNGI
jgi:hypothetical protein